MGNEEEQFWRNERTAIGHKNRGWKDKQVTERMEGRKKEKATFNRKTEKRRKR